MDKFWTLFEITNKNNYNFNKIKSDKKVVKFLGGFALVLFIVLLFLLYSFLYSYLAFDILSPYGLQKIIPSMFAFVAMLLVLMLGINKSKSTLFDSFDNELLFSLPIRPSTILATRIVNFLSINYIFSLAIFVPSVIVYALRASITPMYVISSIIVAILLPILPTIIASIIGYIIAYVNSKLGNTKKLELVITTAFFLVVTYAISFANKYASIILTNLDKAKEIIKSYGYVFYTIYDAMFNNSVISLIIFSVINIVVFLLFVMVLRRGYKNIVISLKNTKRTKSNKKIEYKTNTTIKSLLKKEIKNYFSIPIYAFNTGFGMVMILLFTIYITFFNSSAVLSVINQVRAFGEDKVFLILLATLSFVITMTNTTASSISLEGKRLWILKTIPVSAKKILKSKILLNVVICLPVLLTCTAIISYVIRLDITYTMLLLLIEILLGIATPQFGLLINLKFPKLNYTSETQVVKQSMSAFVGTFLPMCLIMLFFVIYLMVFSGISVYLYIAAIILTLLILIFIQSRVLNKWGIKRFNNF